MPFFFHHRITDDNNVRTLDHEVKGTKDMLCYGSAVHTESHNKTSYVSAVLVLVFEAADRVNRQTQQFVNGFHKMDPRK
jgi:hypothetical protein